MGQKPLMMHGSTPSDPPSPSPGPQTLALTETLFSGPLSIKLPGAYRIGKCLDAANHLLFLVVVSHLDMDSFRRGDEVLLCKCVCMIQVGFLCAPDENFFLDKLVSSWLTCPAVS